MTLDGQVDDDAHLGAELGEGQVVRRGVDGGSSARLFESNDARR